ncbi:MAG: hypothetical protein IKQ18_08110 [Clostridia bacterium]|nr:hypothetical protein [Clostridia bacterium]
MDNKTIYKKTLGFSVRRLFWDLLTFVILAGLAVAGYFVAEKVSQSNGVIGIFIGALIGIIIMAIILRFVSYTLKAGQIAMMTKAITEGELPEDVIAEGKRTVKQRFATVALYYAATRVVKGIFNQLGRAISNVGQAVGGDAGGAVGDAVNSVIQTIISYLCDCCLGWIFYRKDINAAKATCEGAVLFFKHGKTFAKNMGRVFGIGLLSLLLIGGAFAGVFYLILSIPAVVTTFEPVYNKVAEISQGNEGWINRILENRATLPIAFAVIGGIIIWAFIHSTFIKPFVLTGVLRNYLESGINDVPSESSFAMLDSKSEKFRKLHSEI